MRESDEMVMVMVALVVVDYYKGLCKRTEG